MLNRIKSAKLISISAESNHMSAELNHNNADLNCIQVKCNSVTVLKRIILVQLNQSSAEVIHTIAE